MQKIPYSERHPYWFSILIAGMVLAVYIVVGAAAAIARLPQALSERVVHLGSGIILAGTGNMDHFGQGLVAAHRVSPAGQAG